MMRSGRWAAAAMLAVLSLSGCGQGGGDGPVVLHRGNGAPPDTLDPQLADSAWESNIIGDMLTGLYAHGPRGEVVAGVVTDHAISDDGLTHSFALSEDAVWSDGTPVTADDFVYAWRRALDPATASPYASMLYPFENARQINQGAMPPEALGARAIDERTLELRTSSYVPYLATLLTHPVTYPVPRHQVEALGEEWTQPGAYLSNGPYALAEWTADDQLRLVKNPLYPEASDVAIDEVVYYPYGDVSEGFRRFRGGDLDVNACSQCYPIQQVDFIEDRMPGTMRNETILATTYLAFNMEVAPFDDLRVRRAVSLAVDREGLAEEILPSGEVAAYALIPPGIDGYVDQPPVMAEAKWPQDRRLAEAKRLLAEAGFDAENPLAFTLTYRLSGDRKQISVALARMWERAGMRVELEGLAPRDAYRRYSTGEYQVGDAGWIADYNDPQNYLYLLRSDTGRFNQGAYRNEDYDKLLQAAADERDPEARATLLARAEAIILHDLPFAPVYHSVNRNLVGPHVKGWEDNVLGVHRTRWLDISERMRPEY